jgi:hypothetical protein
MYMMMTFGSSGVVQIAAHYEIFMGHEHFGGHDLRISGNGRELEFSGGISFGVAKDFEQFMGGKQLQVVYLNSIGGRIYEAQRIANMIKTKGLDTYVTRQCVSACTIVFLAGRNRLMAPTAKLGFHQPDFPGLTARQRQLMIVAEERRLRRLGISEKFAKRANATPPEDMWFPSPQELVAEKVVTQILSLSK